MDLHRVGYVVPILLALLVHPRVSNGQYTYFSGGFGLSLPEYNASKSFNAPFFQLQALHRPINWLGVGVALGMPLKGSKDIGANVAKVYTTFDAYDESRYAPERSSDIIQHSMDVTGIIRFYTPTNSGLHFDLRLKSMKVTEAIEYHRTNKGFFYSNSVKAVDISYRKAHSLLAPGLFIGLAPHLNRHLFMEVEVGLYFMKFDSEGLYEVIDPKQYFDTGYAFERTLKSSAYGTVPAYSISISFGYLL